MLEWFTFAAALLAAVGTFLGPLVAARSASAARRQAEADASAARRQADVDRYTSFALEQDVVTCRLGVAQLQYLLNTGDLTESQLNAVSEAITAGLRRLQQEIESDPDAVAALENVSLAEVTGLDAPEDTGSVEAGGAL